MDAMIKSRTYFDLWGWNQVELAARNLLLDLQLTRTYLCLVLELSVLKGQGIGSVRFTRRSHNACSSPQDRHSYTELYRGTTYLGCKVIVQRPVICRKLSGKLVAWSCVLQLEL